MNIDSYLNSAVKIDEKREYWYIRTEHGSLYETFKNNGFIALGWNDITVEDIKKAKENPDSFKTKLASLSVAHEKERAKKDKDEVNEYNIIDLNTKRGKSKSSTIMNKLLHFYSLKKGDVVVIPSYGSWSFSFGIIDDDAIYVDLKDSKNCDYRKRRKVKWVVHKDFEELDTKFFTLKKSMHSISSVKEELAEHIDRVMNDLYYKDGFGYYVIRVKKKEDINAQDLFDLGSDLMKLLKIINVNNDFQEQVEGTVVKINVQSDGDFLLKGAIGKSIIIMGTVISLYACDPPRYTPATSEEHHIMENIKSKIDTLELQMHRPGH